jgi:hypothetical protein
LAEILTLPVLTAAPCPELGFLQEDMVAQLMCHGEALMRGKGGAGGATAIDNDLPAAVTAH